MPRLLRLAVSCRLRSGLRPLRGVLTCERHPIDGIVLKKTIDPRPRVEIQQGFEMSWVVRDLLQVAASGAEFNDPVHFYKHAAV